MKRTLYQVGSNTKYSKFALLINGTSPSLTCISTLRYVEAGIVLLPGELQKLFVLGMWKTPGQSFMG